LALTDKSRNNYWIIIGLIIGLLSLIAVLIFIQEKKANLNEIENEKSQINPNIIAIGKYKFDKVNMELSYVDSKIELTGKEADLLLLLHKYANETIEREQILKEVWGDEGDYVGRTLDVFISKLRKKLAADDHVKIINIRGVGYKLVLGT
jgi:DNA-binding response OmpR family regulator